MSKPVTLKGCQMSNNKTTGKLQVVIKSYTKLEQSDDKDLSIENTDTPDTLPISIKQLENMEPYDRATVQIQVMKVKPPTTVTGGKQKQEVIVAVDYIIHYSSSYVYL